MKLRTQTFDGALLWYRGHVEAGGDPTDALTGRRDLTDVIQVFDEVGQRVLGALTAAGMSGRCEQWRSTLLALVQDAAAEHQSKTRRWKRSELHRRAKAYHEAHPEVVIPRRPYIFVKREHLLGVACGFLPEDRPYGEREINKLISGVGMDYAHVRRFLVDEGWMTRHRSTYRLTDLGRRAMRIEHILAEGCVRSRKRE